MPDEHTVELFVLKCAVIEGSLRESLREHNPTYARIDAKSDQNLDRFIRQFELSNRSAAAKMSQHYEMFYMLENDMRKLIGETLEAAHGVEWWDSCVPQAAKDEVKKNQEREAQSGVNMRSDDELDYTTFGQLGEIIRANWGDFAGMMSTVGAVNRVFAALNMLRGTIAHCGMLAEDEVDRLELAVRDWFRILEGPRS